MGCTFEEPTNNAIKPNMILFDKYAKKITLIEGTVCAPDIILTREAERQKYGEMKKLLEKMYPGYNVDQINVVFDFLACYSKQFYTKMEKLIENSKTTTLILEQPQKWIKSQNCEIVSHFYARK